MHVVAKTLWLPKHGNQEAEYEDAFAPDGAELETDVFRCAIADGATEASFSKQWARTLVQAWQKGNLTKAAFLADIGRLQENWRRGFAESRQSKQLPWYAEQKADLGAFATLVGFVLHHDPIAASDQPDQLDGTAPAESLAAEIPATDSPATDSPAPENADATAATPADAPQLGLPWWEAVAVGDSNLFQVREGRLLTAFPLTESAQFDSGPFLVPTRGTAGPDLGRHTLVLHGDWLPRDTFYLMTDALAAWFLGCCERGEQPWDVLERVLAADEPQHAFASLVLGLREQKLLRNDDVTLIRIHVDVALVAAVPATPLLEWDEPAPDDTAAAAATEHTDTQQVREQQS